MKLFPELVPPKLQGHAPRTRMSKREWDAIRQNVFKNANFKCEICLSPRKIQAHERYRVDNNVLVLDDIICLCSSCHNAVHVGRAFANNRGEAAVRRLAKINHVGYADMMEIVKLSFEIWRERQGVEFLDWSLIARRWRNLLSEETRQKAEMSFFSY